MRHNKNVLELSLSLGMKPPKPLGSGEHTSHYSDTQTLRCRILLPAARRKRWAQYNS